MCLDLVGRTRVDAHPATGQHIELVEEHQDFGVGLVDGGDDGDVVVGGEPVQGLDDLEMGRDCSMISKGHSWNSQSAPNCCPAHW